MDKLIFAYDIDGTLRKNSEERHRTEVEPNTRIVDLLIANAHSKNVRTILWSNRGAEYCRDMRKVLGLEKYVKETDCYLKMWLKLQNEALERGETPIVPDVAYDDQQRFDGGKVNVIVREK